MEYLRGTHCFCTLVFTLICHCKGYGFVEFRTEEDADYSIKVMNMVKLFGKPIRVNKASQDKKTLDVGANLFIGNTSLDACALNFATRVCCV